MIYWKSNFSIFSKTHLKIDFSSQPIVYLAFISSVNHTSQANTSWNIPFPKIQSRIFYGFFWKVQNSGIYCFQKFIPESFMDFSKIFMERNGRNRNCITCSLIPGCTRAINYICVYHCSVKLMAQSLSW